MKKSKLTKLLYGVAALGLCVALSGSSKAIASESSTVDIPLRAVTDIDNVPYPSTTPIFFFGEEDRNFTRFTINEPSEVKAYFRWNSNTKGKGTTWFSRDSYGYDVVGESLQLSNKEKSLTTFLDAGTYYLNSVWTEEAYEVGAALLYESSSTEETVAKSSFDKPNSLSLNTIAKGFISDTTPIDYFMFQLDKTANVTIEYSFDGSKSTEDGICGLYDSNRVQIQSASYKKSDSGSKSFMALLQPGVYFIQMSDMPGNTTVVVKPMYYTINLVPESLKYWLKGTLGVNIDTDIKFDEIMVVRKDVADVDIKNKGIWKNSSRNELLIAVDGTTFQVTRNGTYTVRILDEYDNYTLQRIKITNMDITAPRPSGVANGKAYKTSKKITWKDTQSGVNNSKSTLNGKKVKSGVKVTESGKYTLKLYDKLGNYRKVAFTIDFKKPTVGGVYNGGSYSETKTVTFSDSGSGIKKILVNDEELRATTRSKRYGSVGTYVVKVWDKAGNYKRVTFKIRRN